MKNQDKLGEIYKAARSAKHDEVTTLIQALTPEDTQEIFTLILQDAHPAVSLQRITHKIVLNALIKAHPNLDLNRKIKIFPHDSITITPLKYLAQFKFTDLLAVLLREPNLDVTLEDPYEVAAKDPETESIFRKAYIQRFYREALETEDTNLEALLQKYHNPKPSPNEVYEIYWDDCTQALNQETTAKSRLACIKAVKEKLNAPNNALLRYFANNKLDLNAKINEREEQIAEFEKSLSKVLSASSASNTSQWLTAYQGATAITVPAYYFTYDPKQLSTANTVQGNTGGMFGQVEYENYYRWLNYSPPASLATALGFPASAKNWPIQVAVLRMLYAEIYIYDFLKAGNLLSSYLNEKKHLPFLTTDDPLAPFLTDFEMYYYDTMGRTASASQALITVTNNQGKRPLIKTDELINFLRCFINAMNQSKTVQNNPPIKNFIKDHFPEVMTYLFAKPSTTLTSTLTSLFDFTGPKQDKIAVLQKLLIEHIIPCWLPAGRMFGSEFLSEPLSQYNSDSEAQPYLEQICAYTSGRLTPEMMTPDKVLETYAIYLKIKKTMDNYKPQNNSSQPTASRLKKLNEIINEGAKLTEILGSITFLLNRKKAEKTIQNLQQNQEQNIYAQLGALLPSSSPYSAQQMKAAPADEFLKMRLQILLKLHPDKIGQAGNATSISTIDMGAISNLLNEISKEKQQADNSSKMKY